jgi:Fic family protein
MKGADVMRTEMNKKILDPCCEQFYTEYFELLINRLTHSSMSLELDLGDADDSKNAIRLRDNMKAFKYLLNTLFLNKKLSEETIIMTANTINDSSIYISKGYRKFGDHIVDTDIPITPAENIHTEMLKLLLKYETNWKDLDLFEREARFHIEFIHIHPFEDGNGRTGRLLLNLNLLKQGQAPVIITNDLIEYYQIYIHDGDIQGMKNLFQIQSTRENVIIEQLYDEYMRQNISIPKR